MQTGKNSLFSLQEFLLLLLFCAFIALFIHFIREDGIIKNLLFAESIGISIYSTIKAVIWLRHSNNKNNKNYFSSYLIGIPTGGVIGVIIGALLTDTDLKQILSTQQNELLIPMAAAIMFGTVISYFFYSRSKLADQEVRLEEEARKRSEYEKNMMESQLRLLQAQIEPHFLFNSLANVASLIDSDPHSAKTVVEQLSQFLRTSLQRTRNEQSTVKDEVQLLNAYLNIQQVRMGERLNFKIVCPDNLLALPLPPLLVQPLIENAVKHGLENAVEGGSIHLSFQQHDQQLSIIVSDSGNGIQQDQPQGIGLKNIHQRLLALYGKTASLVLTENENGGVKAELLLPLNHRGKIT